MIDRRLTTFYSSFSGTEQQGLTGRKKDVSVGTTITNSGPYAYVFLTSSCCYYLQMVVYVVSAFQYRLLRRFYGYY